MFNVVQVSGHVLKARLFGLEWLLRPLLDGRKAGAGAARRPAEDGAGTASSPRQVIRGESPPPPHKLLEGLGP